MYWVAVVVITGEVVVVEVVTIIICNNNNIGGGGGDDRWDSNRACRTPGWHADMGGSKDGCTNDDNVSLHFIVMRS